MMNNHAYSDHFKWELTNYFTKHTEKNFNKVLGASYVPPKDKNKDDKPTNKEATKYL